MCTIIKRRRRAFRMLTCPGNVLLVKGQEGVRVLLILYEKARF
jgi:hypothetical protein